MTKRITCKDYCELWNSIDKDCEAFGEVHPRPKKCPLWLKRHSVDEIKKSLELEPEKLLLLAELEASRRMIEMLEKEVTCQTKTKQN